MITPKDFFEETSLAYSAMAERDLILQTIEIIDDDWCGTRPKKLPKGDPKVTPPKPSLIPAGTIAVFLARRGTNVLDDVRTAAKVGGEASEKLVKKLQRQLDRRQPVDVGAAIEQMVAEPSFAELRYGGATLVQGLFVPTGLDMSFVVLPYNGGRLTREGLQLAEFAGAKESTLEALVVRNAPLLTPAELAAIRLQDKAELGRNIGNSAWCDTTAWAVAAVVAVVALAVVALATAGCAATIDEHLTDDMIKRLGPNASARRILKLRRESLRSLGG